MSIILTALAVLAGVTGVGAHMSAQDTNELAEKTLQEAQEIYDNAEASLETARTRTEDSLLQLSRTKKRVLDTSVTRFLKVYERVKHIELRPSAGLNEIAKLSITPQAALALREMKDIYKPTLTSGAMGLAAAPTLSIITGLSPLAAFAVPTLLFTGISANRKAEENLEKATTTHKEAEVAAEKMKTTELLCNAITEKANMFHSLLNELDTMFSGCVALLDDVTDARLEQKRIIFKPKKLTEKDLTEDDIRLILVARAIAGAVKTVIDTPILDNQGALAPMATPTYNETKKQLPQFRREMRYLEQANLPAATTAFNQSVACSTSPTPQKSTFPISTSANNGLQLVRNVLAILIGIATGLLSYMHLSNSVLTSVMAVCIVSLAFMNNNTTASPFAFIGKMLRVTLAGAFTVLFYAMSSTLLSTEQYLLKGLLVGVVGFILFIATIPSNNKPLNSVKMTLCRVSACVAFAAVGLLLYALLAGGLGLNYSIVHYIIVAIYGFFALVATCFIEST